jgi:hypothetical protein
MSRHDDRVSLRQMLDHIEGWGVRANNQANCPVEGPGISQVWPPLPAERLIVGPDPTSCCPGISSLVYITTFPCASGTSSHQSLAERDRREIIGLKRRVLVVRKRVAADDRVEHAHDDPQFERLPVPSATSSRAGPADDDGIVWNASSRRARGVSLALRGGGSARRRTHRR